MHELSVVFEFENELITHIYQFVGGRYVRYRVRHDDRSIKITSEGVVVDDMSKDQGRRSFSFLTINSDTAELRKGDVIEM